MADPDLQIRGEAGHPDSEIRGGGDGGLKKIFFFGPLGLIFGLNINYGKTEQNKLKLCSLT